MGDAVEFVNHARSLVEVAGLAFDQQQPVAVGGDAIEFVAHVFTRVGHVGGLGPGIKQDACLFPL